MQIDLPGQYIAVSFTPDNGKLREKAVRLAAKLQIPFVEDIAADEKMLLLFYGEEGLSLCRFYGRHKRRQNVLFVDFVSGKNGYRLAHNCTIKQPLARAVGIKSGVRPQIVDATAGLGGDSFVLACLGCRVLMYERNPVIAALLLDGMQRAALTENPQLQQIMARMTLYNEESIQILGGVQSDTVYLDPMFPHSKSNAAKKGSMQVLQGLLGEDLDQGTLMAAAESSRAGRIAVKRSKRAPYISCREPSFSIVGKSCRYDIYIQS